MDNVIHIDKTYNIRNSCTNRPIYIIIVVIIIIIDVIFLLVVLLFDAQYMYFRGSLTLIEM